MRITVNNVDGATTFLLFDVWVGLAGDAFVLDNAAHFSKVPVPAALPLLVCALLGLGLMGRRTRRRIS